MVVFFKCSFRSSHGFSLSRYDIERKELSFLSEKSNNLNRSIPQTIEYTLSHQLGRCLILATDEDGSYFLGIYRLIEGNDDKYVNAVFYDPGNPRRIIALYNYFCDNQYSATRKLLKAVLRTDDADSTNLEYEISDEKIQGILSDSEMYVSAAEIKTCSSNFLLAFITTDEYTDYQITLVEKFNTTKMFRSEHFDVNSEKIIDYHLATKSFYAPSFPVPIPLAICGGIGIIGLIVLLIILL